MAAGIAPIRPSPYSNRAPLKPTAFASDRAVLPPRIRISKVRKSLSPSAPAPAKWSSRAPAISCILAMQFIFRPMYRTDTAILFPNHCCSPQCFPTAAPMKDLRFLHKTSPPPIWKRCFLCNRTIKLCRLSRPCAREVSRSIQVRPALCEVFQILIRMIRRREVCKEDRFFLPACCQHNSLGVHRLTAPAIGEIPFLSHRVDRQD